MNKIKKGLGRGLSSLIGETKVEDKTNNLSLAEIVRRLVGSEMCIRDRPNPFFILFITQHSQLYFPVP